MSLPFPSPTTPMSSRSDVLVAYLDFFRERVIDKVTALPEPERRTSRLPSGWTPLELTRHLTFVERRWLVWGFLGRDIGNPWGDEVDGRWCVDDSECAAAVVAELTKQGRVTARIAHGHDLDEIGAPGPRWDGADPAGLERVLLHLIQEYARHLGHLDIVTEIAGE